MWWSKLRNLFLRKAKNKSDTSVNRNTLEIEDDDIVEESDNQDSDYYTEEDYDEICHCIGKSNNNAVCFKESYVRRIFTLLFYRKSNFY